MKIGLDTNVIVSGLLSSVGPPAKIVSLVAQGVLQVCYDKRILEEYAEVLSRSKFKFERSAIDDFIEQLKADGLEVTGAPLPSRLPDPDDEMFLEVVVAGNASCLVTGNLKHFPEEGRAGVRVLTPRQLVDLLPE